jgi:hypothetical protein
MIQFASPGTKDWAKAMLREMDFIESDWSALLWSFGSTRILFRRRDVPVTSVGDVPRAAQNFAKKIQRRTRSVFIVTLFESVCFGSFILFFPNLMQRIGSGLTVVAMLFMMYQVLARRPREVPGETDASICVVAYRAELERQRDFHRSWWFWSRWVIMLPGFVLFCLGFSTAHPETASINHWTLFSFVALAIAAIPLNLGLACKYQRQIDELDALPKEL